MNENNKKQRFCIICTKQLTYYIQNIQIIVFRYFSIDFSYFMCYNLIKNKGNTPQHNNKPNKGGKVDIMRKSKIFSEGNKKLSGGSVHFFQFNIPARLTCPNASPDCKKFCYAAIAERIYTNTRNQRARNYELTECKDFVEIISNELENILYRNNNIIRIHESGDFYNYEYFKKWVKIAEKFPDVIFMAYTKSFEILKKYRKPLPKNFLIRCSLDDSNVKEWGAFVGRLGYPIYYAGDLAGAVPCRCKECGSCLLCYGKTNKDISCKIH